MWGGGSRGTLAATEPGQCQGGVGGPEIPLGQGMVALGHRLGAGGRRGTCRLRLDVGERGGELLWAFGKGENRRLTPEIGEHFLEGAFQREMLQVLLKMGPWPPGLLGVWPAFIPPTLRVLTPWLPVGAPRRVPFSSLCSWIASSFLLESRESRVDQRHGSLKAPANVN